MTAFRIFLVAFVSVLLVYTLLVIANHGASLFPVFFGDMARMGWAGQFNLDFSGYLLLAGIWTAWRNGFSAPAFALSVLAVFGGMLFLSIYLLYLSYAERGDPRRMLLGAHRVRDDGLE